MYLGELLTYEKYHDCESAEEGCSLMRSTMTVSLLRRGVNL